MNPPARSTASDVLRGSGPQGSGPSPGSETSHIATETDGRLSPSMRSSLASKLTADPEKGALVASTGDNDEDDVQEDRYRL